jgi:soluble lytic murein transglycosylase-like protein
VAIEFGFKGFYLTELCDPDTGLDFGCRKLQKCFDTHGRDVENSLLAYNGGSDPNYPNLVLQYQAAYE